MNCSKLFRSLLVLALAAALASCGSNSSNNAVNPPANQPSGTVFLVGTDAPLASVLSFRVTLTGMTVSDGTAQNTHSVLSGPQDVDFARLNGLHSLLDLNTIPAGTYTTVNITLANPVIGFLDVSVNPPKINTLDANSTPKATLSTSSVTILLPQALVVNNGDLIGLLFDFHLRDSIQVDAGGNLTGLVVPNIDLRAIPPDAPEADIDEFRGGVVSVNTAQQSFVMQGPRGRQFTVQTNAQTMWGPDGENLSTLDTNTIVAVSGSLQRNSLTILATDIMVLSKDHFLLGGLVTDVRPSTGTANQFDLLVRSELPDLSGVPVGQISTLNLTGTERFGIYELRIPLVAFIFNSSSMVRGQDVTAGGALDTTKTPPALNLRRVVLHRQGLEGAWVVGSTNAAAGTFMFSANGLTGVAFNQPVKVFTTSLTRFVGLPGIGGLSGTSPIRLRVVGLVLKDTSGNPAIVARVVQKF